MEKYRIAYDTELKRPACVLVAVGMGADREPAMWFDPKHWLLAPTPDMHVYEITPSQLRWLVYYTEGHARKREKK